MVCDMIQNWGKDPWLDELPSAICTHGGFCFQSSSEILSSWAEDGAELGDIAHWVNSSSWSPSTPGTSCEGSRLLQGEHSRHQETIYGQERTRDNQMWFIGSKIGSLSFDISKGLESLHFSWIHMGENPLNRKEN